MERGAPTCIAPLVDESFFPDTGGYVLGRWCREINLGAGNVSCCLPCPVSAWRYSDAFDGKMDIAGWCAIAIIVSMVFMGLTYTLLPPSATARHYLTTTPMLGFVLVSTAFIVPLAHAPDQCHDMITPNDHHSDPMCAATSTLLISGIWVVVISCLFRSLSLHLMVVWERTLGNKYMFASLTCIVGGAVLLLVLDLEVTGVSYQLGRVCYINPYKGWGTFWIPLLVITALTFLFQVLTMAYCVFIVLRPIYHERTILLRRRQPRTSVEYRLGAKARQASIQTRKILRMQWRPVLIVFMVIFNVVFLSTIFLEAESMYTYPTERFVPWVACLAVSGKENCMTLANGLGPNENLILTVLVLLAVCGIWGVFLVFRSSMLLAWIDLFKGKSRSSRSRIAHLDAEAATQERFQPRPRTQSTECELSRLPKHQCVASVSDDSHSDHTYVVPEHSFSAPVRPKIAYSQTNG
ncbi:hypothetical protein OIDMADRAFT_110844 [Oidiodendron maius Zn]|uniref:G-protein coupled receptors family 2 profile 2 domain-containing protein n=1 Tax=Oidiodendron maius (strain Zn) TaxID=913774 RepID=A0A0C3D753_OIDMZ|nr:hypothetical protein OIDMADRAFT_110844 [Oidiodendron maius Zn]